MTADPSTTTGRSPREAPWAPAGWSGRRPPRVADPIAGVVIAVNLVISAVYTAIVLPLGASVGWSADELSAYGPLAFGWISMVIAAPAALAYLAWMLLRGFTPGLSALALVVGLAAAIGLGGPLLAIHVSGSRIAGPVIDGLLAVIVVWLVVDAQRRRRAERRAGRGR